MTCKHTVDEVARLSIRATLNRDRREIDLSTKIHSALTRHPDLECGEPFDGVGECKYLAHVLLCEENE